MSGFRTVHLPETWIGVDADTADYFQRVFDDGQKILGEAIKNGYKVQQITTVVYREALWATYLLTK